MVTQRFAGRVFAVTGAASGIGRSVAILLHQGGASLALADIQPEPLADLEKHLLKLSPTATNRIRTARVDITNSVAVEQWIESAVASLGPLDGAANIAGFARYNDFPDGITNVTDEDWERMIGVNLTGLFYCLRAQLRPGRFKSGGSLVTCGSAMSKLGAAKDGGYSAAKHGVLGLSKSLAKELGPREIRVNCICPGPINTPMLRGALAKLGLESLPGPAIPRIAESEEVANLVAFLLSDDSKFISGTDLSIDGAWCC